jgi:glucose-6-phosphate isomerase
MAKKGLLYASRRSVLDISVAKLHFLRAKISSARRKGKVMKLMEPGVCRVDAASGQLIGATNRYQKTLADLEGLYEDTAAFEALRREWGEAVVYEVTDFKPSANPGDMIVGVTRMSPGKVGREYFLTRGHIHAIANRPEMYYGESGRGVMLLESPEGDIRAVEIAPRVMCYVPPYWIHRSVNTGADELVMTFAYPADSGQDYAIIEEAGGMKARVVEDGAGGWKLADNVNYRGRPDSRIARVYASASRPGAAT